MLGGFFGFSQRGTNLRTEVIAGLTTFMTMAYIIFVNPAILGTEGTGLPISGVFFATCVAAAVSCVVLDVLNREVLGMRTPLPSPRLLVASLGTLVVTATLDGVGIGPWAIAGVAAVPVLLVVTATVGSADVRRIRRLVVAGSAT